MDEMLLWGLVLLAGAVLLLAIDVFVPSGVLSILAAGAAIAGVVCLFRHSATWGFIGLAAVLIGGPLLTLFGLHIMPSTPLGRQLVLGAKDDAGEDEHDGAGAADGGDNPLEKLVGREGVAVTDLRPAGQVRVDGSRVEAVSETTLVRAGDAVRVTGAEPGRVRVRVATGAGAGGSAGA